MGIPKKTLIETQNQLLDKLRHEVAAVSDAVQNLKASGIDEDVLAMLIQYAAPHRINRESVKNVLEGIEALESRVFPNEDDRHA